MPDETEIQAVSRAIKRAQERSGADIEAARRERDARAIIANWMIANGFPTGHGDTVDDLLWELVACVSEARRNEGHSCG